MYRFSKKARMSSLIKIRPVGAELFRPDRQTDRLKDRHEEANSHFFSILQTRLKIKLRGRTCLCLCVCIYMCIYIRICVYIYVCVYIYIRICVCVFYICVYVYIHIYVYIYICVHIYAYMCVCLCFIYVYVYIHIYVYIYTYMCVYIYVYVCIYMCIYIRMYVCVCLCMFCHLLNRIFGVGVVTRLREGRSRVRIPAGTRCSALLHSDETGCEGHLAFYSWSTGALSPRSKRSGRETDTLLPVMSWLRLSGVRGIPPLPLYVLWRVQGQLCPLPFTIYSFIF